MDEPTVACTACGEPVPVEDDECPDCGKSFITRHQATVMILYVYPVVLPVPAVLLAAAIPPAWYGVDRLLVFGGFAALFYSLAAGWTWLVYRRRRQRIDRALAAAER